MSDSYPLSCRHDEPAKSRLGASGIDSYDTVEMHGEEPPHVTHAFQSASMASVYQRVLTPENFRPIEIHVRRQSRAVLLMRLGDLCRQPCRIAGVPSTLHVPPGTSLYLPAGTDSWWASDAACVNGWFHLHFSDATVHAVEEDTGIRLLSHETRVDLPLLGLVKAAEEMTREGKVPSALAWDSLAIVILDRLARLEGASQRSVTRLERLSPHQVKKVSDYLHAHLADQTPLAHLASLLELSPSTSPRIPQHGGDAPSSLSGGAPHAAGEGAPSDHAHLHPRRRMPRRLRIPFQLLPLLQARVRDVSHPVPRPRRRGDLAFRLTACGDIAHVPALAGRLKASTVISDCHETLAKVALRRGGPRWF